MIEYNAQVHSILQQSRTITRAIGFDYCEIKNRVEAMKDDPARIKYLKKIHDEASSLQKSLYYFFSFDLPTDKDELRLFYDELIANSRSKHFADFVVVLRDAILGKSTIGPDLIATELDFIDCILSFCRSNIVFFRGLSRFNDTLLTDAPDDNIVNQPSEWKPTDESIVALYLLKKNLDNQFFSTNMNQSQLAKKIAASLGQPKRSQSLRQAIRKLKERGEIPPEVQSIFSDIPL